MKPLIFLASLLAVLALVVVLFLAVIWPLENDVSAPLNRAQVSASADDMLHWLLRVRDGMTRRGMTSGYATIFKHTVDYDYAAIFRAVNGLITRTETATRMDRSSVAYQSAMDDLRGVARELDLHPREYCLKHFGWWFALLALLLAIPGAAIVADELSKGM